MIIEYIKLVGYTRMPLAQVETFEMHLRERIQLILGTNGSGKSSLLRELTPLPANKDDFTKEGSKTIRISHRGHTYVLTSSFSPKQTHSFEKDGDELNPGGTVTVQKELVEQEFNYSADVLALISGSDRFTQMGPTQRRQWFTRLSDTSYDYALSIYDTLRVRSRDITGSLRKTKERLVAETAKIISPEEQDRLKREVDALHAEMRELIALSAPVEHNLSELQSRHENGLAELNAMSMRLLRTRYSPPLAAYGASDGLRRNEWGQLEAPNFTSIEDIEAYLVRLREAIAAEEALINSAVREHKQLEGNLEILKRTGADGIKSLSTRLHDLQDKRNTLLAGRKLKIEGLDPQLAVPAFEGCRDVLFEVFNAIPENSDKRFSQVVIKEFTDRLNAARTTQHRLQREAAETAAKRQHLEQHRANGENECPKCHHRWNPGFSESMAKALQQQDEETTQALAKQTAEIKLCEERLAALAEYAGLYRQYVTCVRGNPSLQAFWDYLAEKNLVVDAPRQALTLLTVFERDLEIEQEAQRVEGEITEVKKLISQAAQVGDASLAETQTKLTDLTIRIESMTQHLSMLRNRHSEHADYKRDLAEAIALSVKIDRLAKDLEGLTATIVDTTWRETIAHCIRQVGSQLSKKEDTLNAVMTQVNRVKDLEEQIKFLEIEELASKIIVSELSPTDGLIAEGLMGFIRTFVKQMNNLIKKIWTYTLRIQECGVSTDRGAELDYKFPILVQNAENRRKDVSEGSDGMQEVIDLAYRVVAAKYLGLAESPLMLDEFGRTFDDAHRFAAVNCVKNLMEQSSFTQLFMVSHYETSYSAFTQAEVCVLDKANIVVPVTMKYNQHVVMT